MACCFKSTKLADLDPVSFFIVTEIMKAEQEQQQKRQTDSQNLSAMELIFEFGPKLEVA